MTKIFETPLYPYCHSPDQDLHEPLHHKVVVVGAGPIGMSAAIDLIQHGVETLILDDNDRVSWGSRAICFAKRPLEILDRLGCGQPMIDKGIAWNLGRVYFDDRQVYEFNLLPEPGHKRPAFINLQQYYLEIHMLNRLRELEALGKPMQLRGKNRVIAITDEGKTVLLSVQTPDGIYQIRADYVICCDGASSPLRAMLGLHFVGRVFEDNFLIADIVLDEALNFPTERRFWFDPPFNRGQSALLHKQPDNVWRIDLQLGCAIDREIETEPERVISRIEAFLGQTVKFELDWVSIYTFQCRRMEKFRHGRVIFAGDAAHQVSPFGARGANSGLQDTDNLVWKLKLVLDGTAPETLLETYTIERVLAAEENILNSSRSTDFITPKSEISKIFRNAVLELSEHVPGIRPLVNSGRLSVPCTYDGSPLNGADDPDMPHQTRPGSPIVDLPVDDGWLIDKLGNQFRLITIDTDAPETSEIAGIWINRLALTTASAHGAFQRERYLGNVKTAVYLIRPDQHVVARWKTFDAAALTTAVLTATGRS